jgi:hypothetical protein
VCVVNPTVVYLRSSDLLLNLKRRAETERGKARGWALATTGKLANPALRRAMQKQPED